MLLLRRQQNLRQHHQSQTNTIYLEHRSTTPKEIERERERERETGMPLPLFGIIESL